MNPEIRDLLEGVKERSGAASLSEVFRRSLALYAGVVDLVNDGGTVIFRKDGSDKEILPLLG